MEDFRTDLLAALQVNIRSRHQNMELWLHGLELVFHLLVVSENIQSSPHAHPPVACPKTLTIVPRPGWVGESKLKSMQTAVPAV